MTLKRVLVANRGEIAVRLIRACRAEGVETVVVSSEADKRSLATELATKSVCIGAAPSAKSYLNINAILHVALKTGCDALHPGYGFLSENAEFAGACEREGVVFIGPKAESIALMGNKIEARQHAEKCGVPVLLGSHLLSSVSDAISVAQRVGYPVLIKAAKGGGGRGMKVCSSVEELALKFPLAAAEAKAAFGDGSLYIERYIESAKHIEVQVIGDGKGNVVHLGERDCSSQRRHQKIIEEAPAITLSEPLRARICDTALELARSVNYRSAGTVEFILDQKSEDFFFLEMNTRVQVEHPVTEAVTNVDIVRTQLRLAAGIAFDLKQEEITTNGHAIEVRVNAEDPDAQFRPCPGKLSLWVEPTGPGIRIDTHCRTGYTVPPYYDSLLAKVVCHAASREEARGKMVEALKGFQVDGIRTTAGFTGVLLKEPLFASGRNDTQWVERFIESRQAKPAPIAGGPIGKREIPGPPTSEIEAR